MIALLSPLFGVVTLSLIAISFSQQPFVSVNCFSNFPNSGAINCTQIFTNQFCNSVAIPTTSIAFSNRASRCFNLIDGLGRRCEFTVANNGAVASPSNTNCKNAYAGVSGSTTVTGSQFCDFGGQGTVSGDTFTYTLAIKNGECNTVSLP